MQPPLIPDPNTVRDIEYDRDTELSSVEAVAEAASRTEVGVGRGMTLTSRAAEREPSWPRSETTAAHSKRELRKAEERA